MLEYFLDVFMPTEDIVAHVRHCKQRSFIMLTRDMLTLPYRTYVFYDTSYEHEISVHEIL